jgi:hypothetical protein
MKIGDRIFISSLLVGLWLINMSTVNFSRVNPLTPEGIISVCGMALGGLIVYKGSINTN